MLEKWLCHKCEKGWLLIEEDVKGKVISCPYCGSNGEHVEVAAGQNPVIDYRGKMGCLWPGYNEFDKLGWERKRRQQPRI